MKTSMQSLTRESTDQPATLSSGPQALPRVADTRQTTIERQLDSASRLGHRFDEMDMQPTLTTGSAAKQHQGANADSAGTLHNADGLPQPLKTAIENLSGTSLDDVRVYYNSPEPADLEALAYAQGSEIHVGPGQEEHLPHEAWHVVQQKQGRVKATRQLNGRGLNDSITLEREADAMGNKANSQPVPGYGSGSRGPAPSPISFSQQVASNAGDAGAVQLVKFSELLRYRGKKLQASSKHIKGKPGGTPGKTTKASQEVMDHAKAQIEGDVAEVAGDLPNDVVFDVPRKHRHKKTSAKSRRFYVHKGGGDGNEVGYYMEQGEPSESESSEDEK